MDRDPQAPSPCDRSPSRAGPAATDPRRRPPSRATRPAADPRRRLGDAGEDEAVRHLVARGHAILDRNFRTRYGELDVVSATADCLVFCEVKTRTSGGRHGPASALEAVGPAKRRRLRLMAREWFRLRGGDHERLPASVRFDAIGVVVDPARKLVALDHVEGAF